MYGNSVVSVRFCREPTAPSVRQSLLLRPTPQNRAVGNGSRSPLVGNFHRRAGCCPLEACWGTLCCLRLPASCEREPPASVRWRRGAGRQRGTGRGPLSPSCHPSQGPVDPLPCRASRRCARRWPSAGTTTPRPGSRRSAWRSASASWSTWTGSRGGAAQRRRSPKTAPSALPSSSSRGRPSAAAPWPKSRRSSKLPCRRSPEPGSPLPRWEAVAGSSLCLWRCHRVSCVSTSSGNEMDLTVANNICTLSMPVYTYEIAMFIYIYICLYIHSHARGER